MKFGSLFSGIGGLDLGLERAGMQCVWQSEIDPYASRVLKKHWPDIPNLGDINEIDWQTVPRVDLICGGYPCQPFSLAGARRGENDPRHLWPRFADAIRVLRPRFALLENVTGHLSLGFGDVQADLAALGYDTQWDCIPAAAVGAPHLRDRVFIIATQQYGMDTNSNSKSNVTVNAATEPSNETIMGDTDNARGRTPGNDNQRKWSQDSQIKQRQQPLNRFGRSGQTMADTTSTLGQRGCLPCGRKQAHANTDLSSIERSNWAIEPQVGRMANGIPDRMDRLRGLGNAVVPQVAEHIGNIIMEMAT